MDVHSLKNYIINNPHYIELVLEKSDFHYIEKDLKRKEIRCARDIGRNPTSVKVNINTLSATCFSTNLKGDLITLVQSKLRINFYQTLKFISEIIDFKEELRQEYKAPFGGFYKNICKLRGDLDINIDTIDDNILDRFDLSPSLLFLKDGISIETQMKYKIGYDAYSGRIAVPWYSMDGKGIVGVMGRLNKKNVEDDEVKWHPIIPFPKSKSLYGFSHNYSNIQDKGIVMIGESEKHTLSLHSMGLDVGISLGGCFLSEYQANNIKSLFPEKIIIMLDEGLEEEHSVEMANQLKSNKYYNNNVGYVYDKNNLYLPKGSKLAPSDLPKRELSKLIKDCTIWI